MGRRSKSSRDSSILDSSKPKRRKRSSTNQSLDSTSLSNYSNLTEDLETNEIVGRLRSIDANERLYCVDTLSKIFADPESNLSDENPSLWDDFLSRFCDADRDVRFHMVQSAVGICCNRPDLRNVTIDALVQRSRDPDEKIRHEVVDAITTIVEHDYAILSEKLLTVLKERTLDKKFEVRRKALLALGSYYRRAAREHVEAEQKRFDWVKNKILHAYYQYSLEDRLLCEKLTYTTLVNYLLETEERMDVLFDLYCSVDDNAVKALNEIFRQQHVLRRLVRTILVLLSKEQFERDDNEVAIKIRNLADRFPSSGRVTEQLRELFDFLSKDMEAFHLMEYLVGHDFTTAEVAETIKKLFVKVSLQAESEAEPGSLQTKPKSRPGSLHAVARQLVERCAPVILDPDGVKILVSKVMSVLVSPVPVEGVSEEQVFQRSFNLLLVLSYSFPALFRSAEVIDSLTIFLQHGNSIAADIALRILCNCAEEVPGFLSESASDKLIPELKNLATFGSPKVAKHAAVCLATSTRRVEVLQDVMQEVKERLVISNPGVESALACLTSVAKFAPVDFKRDLSAATVSVVRDIILNDEYASSSNESVEEWRPLDELSAEARAKVAGVKFLPRWVIGQKSNEHDSASKTITLLGAILAKRGDVKDSGKLNYSERAAMRLASAQALLKMMHEKTFVNSLTMVQFRVLARVIVDECRYVRERFATKLQAALHSLKLPLEFMAIYCLAPTFQAEDQKLVQAFTRRIQSCIIENVVVRRDFIRKNPAVQCRPQEFLPEYYLSYVVYLLSNLETYTAHDDVDALQDIQKCLSFAMDPLLNQSPPDNAMGQFLHKLFLDIKQTRNAENPGDERQNKKMWAVCDLALVLLTRWVPNYVSKDHAYRSLLSARCFTSPMKTMSNTTVYLPNEMLPKGFDKSTFDVSVE